CPSLGSPLARLCPCQGMIWPSPPWVEAPQLRQLCPRVRAGFAGKELPGRSLPARICFEHLSCFPLPKALCYGLLAHRCSRKEDRSGRDYVSIKVGYLKTVLILL